ncbi:unnamed protein product [Ambrosiozyma monospora]|uniref:Unnamed protein product n=1 Tax=Ambrosiozyma monospora TaxID=43982 RepID=A0ACB5TDJ9_AMBMO|nr:unnamed protein product [Ambrosiozyma monospora]
MTITKQEIVDSLSDLDFNSYNFLRNSYQFSEGDEKLYNLLEIYSFGTISEYSGMFSLYYGYFDLPIDWFGQTFNLC